MKNVLKRFELPMAYAAEAARYVKKRCVNRVKEEIEVHKDDWRHHILLLNQNTPAIILRDVHARNETSKIGVNDGTRVYLSSHTNTPADVLEALAFVDDIVVQRNVYHHENTPKRLRVMLQAQLQASGVQLGRVMRLNASPFSVLRPDPTLTMDSLTEAVAELQARHAGLNQNFWQVVDGGP